LKEIGVVAVGHRRKILGAIEKLAETGSADKPGPITFPHAERRQLTVMFCDLVGSTALSARLDPEDIQELLRAYQSKVVDVVSGFGGYISKFLGDGVLIYFGYPQAHEDDAECAIRAGLSLVRGIGQLSASGHEPLHARIGIATGLVVVGDLIGSGEAQERGVAGETPNLAARLQSLAEPDTVIIADGTRRLVGDLFELSELALAALKGFAEPVRAWRVLGEGHAESRFRAMHGTRLTPFVGRGEELNLVLSRWQHAKEGSGQVVLLSGEPGIGKSRLVLSLRERLHDEPKAVAQIGACLGREFDHELLSAVVPLPEAELAAALDQLVAAELVFRRGVPPATTYVFKHALVRDAAYESLLRKRRRSLHARIANAIETRFARTLDAQPELVAHHFSEAGLPEKAIGYWLQAGRLAAGRSANVEAVAHLRAGLASINGLPPSVSPLQWELS